jgi:pimeloyl-ACP methyl ester carboxylesterase
MASLTQVHKSAKPDALNVIFVHGLGGDSRLTWMNNPRDHATLWPCWIGEDVDCNVWIASYGAALSGWTDAAMHLVDQGEAFFAALQAEPNLQGRKIVVVGHSLGGLVIKSGMTQAQTLGDSRREAVLADVAAVVFIGTPHQGSILATIASNLGATARINPQVVNMASDDAWLKLLNGQFRNLQVQRRFGVRVFFETRGVLIGRNLWRLKIGARVTIVDRNSSDPGIAGVVSTGIEGDHFEIAKPKSRQDFVHKALVDFLRNVIDAPPPTIPIAAVVATNWPERSELVRGLRNASAPLLSWPSTLPDGTWLERPELAALSSSLNGSETSTNFLLGEPGCGKSSLLVRLAQDKQSAGWAVLAIKADRLPAEALDREALNRYLNLGADVTAVLRHLAQSEPVLVVIDQLDALADLVVQQSGRLRVLLELVQDLSDVPGVHTVISCRTFEHKHDPALRNLDASVRTLDLPAWPVVLPVLAARGLHADAWNEEIQQVLRSPHALDIFLSSLEGATEPAALKSFQGLLEQQWESQVLSDSTGKRRNTLRHLAKLMAEREVLGLPLAIVEEHYAEIQMLAAAGLLRMDQAPGRVEFRHQTLYEFVRARTFLEESGSLTEAVRRQQDSLRIRPQLWHALGYFRTASPEEYGVEIDKLWEAGLRAHLKTLLIEFLGRQTAPLAAEQRLVERSMTDQWFVPRFIGSAIGSPGWFTFLAQIHLPGFMGSQDDQAQCLLPLLRQALHFDPDTVIRLVNRHWLPNPTRDILSWQVLGMGDVAPQIGLWLDSLVLIAGRTSISEWAIGHAAGVVSAVLPDDAPRLIAAWLKRHIDAAKAQMPTDSSNEDAAVVAASVAKSLQTTLEVRQFVELEAIAEAAPRAFILAIWPHLVEALSLCSPDESSVVVGYRQSSGLLFQELDEEESRTERPLFRSIQLAVRNWAENDAADFLDFADAQAGSDLLLVHRLTSVGRVGAAKHFPLRVFEYLVADSRRLVLGSYSDVHKESVDLIEAVSRLLDEPSLVCLERLLIDWHYYKDTAQSEDDASVRQRRHRSARQHRLRLLRAIPLSRRSAATQRLVEEEERAFPGLANNDVSFLSGGWIGSPVSAAQMDKGSDSDVLNLFSELTDESAWDHPRDRMKGGAIQAGRELASLAKRNLDKAIRIVGALQPVVNEIPVAAVLRELVPSGLEVQALYSLIEELEDKGFVSSGFRREAAYAIANVGNRKSPVPDTLVDRMERWLTPSVSESSDESESNEIDVNSAVLWGHRSLSALPNGNYPTLSALTTSCLATDPSRIDRWLGILERHVARNESPLVWEALLQRELRHLRMADCCRAESLVDQLVESFPGLVNGNGWIHFVANANHWATAVAVRRWVIRTVETAQNKQGAGELIALRHALFPAETWSREIAYSLEGGFNSIALGLAHGVAHLWHDPMTRPVVHPILLRLLRSDDEKVLNALTAVIMQDGFAAGLETRELLDTFVAHPSVLKNGRAEQLPELLAKLVTAEPERVCGVAHALLDTAGDQMGNIATSWYLSTEWLLDIALQLQDMGEAERAAGSTLFERMLEFNMPQAKEMTFELDKRTPAGESPRAPVRRRSRPKRTKPAGRQCAS